MTLLKWSAAAKNGLPLLKTPIATHTLERYTLGVVDIGFRAEGGLAKLWTKYTHIFEENHNQRIIFFLQNRTGIMKKTVLAVKSPCVLKTCATPHMGI